MSSETSLEITDRKTFPVRKLVLFVCAVTAIAGGGYWSLNAIPQLFSKAEVQVATARAKIMVLRDVIVEQGTLESQNTVNGICQIQGYENKIISLVAEGTKVKKGEVVVKFDDAKLLKEMENQELEITEAQSDLEDAKQEVTVQVNANESAIRAAKQAWDFAKIDLKKYLEGDFLVSKADQEGAISEADTEVKKRERELESMRVYVKRGFRQYEQLREAKQALESAQLRLKRDKQKYDMLIRFDHVKKKAELEGKLTEAEFKWESEKETAKAKLAKAEDKLDYRERRLKMKKETLERMKENHNRFVIKAPQDGTIAFPVNNNYGRENQIREGGIVYQNQTVFYLPNMRKMQVKVDVHESMVSKVKVGQKVIVRVDAFQNYPLEGVVSKVATLAENSYFTTAKNYKAIIKIDKIPDEIALKPGMTSKAEIVCGIYRDVLCVPVQGVTTKFGKAFAYVKSQNEFERREIEINRNNVSFVEVTRGLEAGDEIALDAYERSIEDFAGVEAEELAVVDDETPADEVNSPLETEEVSEPETPESLPTEVLTSEESKSDETKSDESNSEKRRNGLKKKSKPNPDAKLNQSADPKADNAVKEKAGSVTEKDGGKNAGVKNESGSTKTPAPEKFESTAASKPNSESSPPQD